MGRGPPQRWALSVVSKTIALTYALLTRLINYLP